MVFPRRLLPWTVAAVTILTPACRRPVSQPLDPATASCIPAGTRALAGLDLDAIRRSPLYTGLSPESRTAFDFVPQASRLLLAWNGAELLTLAEGQFDSAPAGFTLLGPRVAAAGSSDIVRRAQRQQQTGHAGVPDLLAWASGIPQNPSIWIVAAGDAALPLSGNLANVGHLLRYTRYTTVSARVRESLEIEAAGVCASPARAQELEEKLRALLSLLSAAGRRSPLAEIRDNARIAATGDTVRVTMSIPADLSARALALLAH